MLNSEQVEKNIKRVRRLYQSLPDKKRYVEFLTAILTVPVLLTVIILNVQNLKKEETPVPSATPNPTIQVTVVAPTPTETKTKPQLSTTPAPSSNPLVCSPTIAPIDIVSPANKQVIQKDPVCIDIAYEQGNSCGVVWSYQVNNSSWSDYTDKAICLYGLTPGEKELRLRIKSLKGTDEKIITRQFTVAGPTPTMTPQATSSAGLQ